MYNFDKSGLLGTYIKRWNIVCSKTKFPTHPNYQNQGRLFQTF